METNRVGIVGSSGFVGSFLADYLDKKGFEVTGFQRSDVVSARCPVRQIGNVETSSSYEGVFEGIETLVYTVGRTHQLNEQGEELEMVYDQINYQSTMKIAESALTQGVKRFIFLSSIKVLGEATHDGSRLDHASTPQPSSPYGTSKLKAENGLLSLARKSGFSVVIVRPPLIYGRGVKGNLGLLTNALKKRLPIPFGGLSKNCRSMVSVESLCSLIEVCVLHPLAHNEVFLVREDKEFSTREIVELLAKQNEVPAFLFPIPDALLRLLLHALGKRELVQRLLGDLLVDDERTRNLLGWRPTI